MIKMGKLKMHVFLILFALVFTGCKSSTVNEMTFELETKYQLKDEFVIQFENASILPTELFVSQNMCGTEGRQPYILSLTLKINNQSDKEKLLQSELKPSLILDGETYHQSFYEQKLQNNPFLDVSFQPENKVTKLSSNKEKTFRVYFEVPDTINQENSTFVLLDHSNQSILELDINPSLYQVSMQKIEKNQPIQIDGKSLEITDIYQDGVKMGIIFKGELHADFFLMDQENVYWRLSELEKLEDGINIAYYNFEFANSDKVWNVQIKNCVVALDHQYYSFQW